MVVPPQDPLNDGIEPMEGLFLNASHFAIFL